VVAGRPHDRAVEVIVTTPMGVSVNNLQELAEKAWQPVNKSITIGGVTVKVRAVTGLEKVETGA
jgi:hypothetical protein